MKQVKMVSQFYVHKSQGRIAKFSESYHPSSSTADNRWWHWCGTSISCHGITCTSILHINAVRKCYVSRQTNGEERQDEYLTDFSVLHGFH